LGPDSPETIESRTYSRDTTPQGLTPRGKPGNGTVEGHRGQDPALHALGLGQTLQARTRSPPNTNGPPRGELGLGHAGRGAGVAPPAHAPTVTPPVPCEPATVLPWLGRAVGYPPPAGRVRAPGCRRFPLLSLPHPW